MPNDKEVAPPCNAAKTSRRNLNEIQQEIVDQVILTDDLTNDNTSDPAPELGLITIRLDHWHLAKPGFLADAPAQTMRPDQLEPHRQPFSSNRG